MPAGDAGDHGTVRMQEVVGKIQVPAHWLQQFRTAQRRRGQAQRPVTDRVVDPGATLAVLPICIDINGLCQVGLDRVQYIQLRKEFQGLRQR